MFDSVTAFGPSESGVLKTWNTIEDGTKSVTKVMDATSQVVSQEMSAAEGSSFGMQVLDAGLSHIPWVSSLKGVFTYQVKSDVCQRLGNSEPKIREFYTSLSNLSQSDQEELANLLKGRSAKAQANILEAYANGRKGYSR